MNKAQSLILLAVTLGLFGVGCGSSEAPATPEEKKAFMGGPMPKDFMKDHVNAGAAAAAAQKPAANPPAAK